MMVIVDIHWTRRVRNPEMPDSGKTTMAEFAPTETRARTKAAQKFLRHYGVHRAITHTTSRVPEPKASIIRTA